MLPSPLALVPSFVTRLEEVKASIETTDDLREVTRLRQKSGLLYHYVVLAKFGLQAQNAVVEVKLRAERKAGALLHMMIRHEGGRPRKPLPEVRVLADLGITWKQSSQWQQEARVPEADFERYVTKTKEAGEELSSFGLLLLAGRLFPPSPTVTPKLPPGKYRCITLDPPWPMQQIQRKIFPMQSKYLAYPTLNVEAISAVPIRDFAYEGGCHVYLWVTHHFLPFGFELFETWGVKYECQLTWIKPAGFTPYSWNYNTEHVLFGRIGHLPLLRNGVKLSFEEPSLKHSRKPDCFYEIVRRVSPGPRIDMFAREPRAGFESWGNEAPQSRNGTYL